MGKEVRGKIPTTRVDRIPPYGAGDSRETSPSPSFGAWQKQAGGEKGSERDLNSGGKTRVVMAETNSPQKYSKRYKVYAYKPSVYLFAGAPICIKNEIKLLSSNFEAIQIA